MDKNIRHYFFSDIDWPLQAARMIQNEVDAKLSENGACSVMLTGGNTARKLYEQWARLPEFTSLKGVNFYFGDERCVPSGHQEANFTMTLESLFSKDLLSNNNIFPIYCTGNSASELANYYERVLPSIIDILLLTVGNDGHIASLFPNSQALKAKTAVVSTLSPMPPYERITITRKVVENARSIFVLAPGDEKLKIYKKAESDTENYFEMPVRLILKIGTWIFTKPN